MRQRHPGLPRVLGSVSMGHLCWTQRWEPPECCHLRAPSHGESRAARAGMLGAAAAGAAVRCLPAGSCSVQNRSHSANWISKDRREILHVLRSRAADRNL